MIALNHDEAILFRVLADFFGRDRVIHGMSVLAVCGGELPDTEFLGLHQSVQESVRITQWARKNKCLFTIIDQMDNPKMVVEFFSGYENYIDLVELDHQTFLPALLEAAGIRYVTMSTCEFSEIIDPQKSLDFVSFLEAKVYNEI